MTWYYQDNEFTEVPEDIVGFVYCITNIKTGKQYIGKKNIYSRRRVKVKGRAKKKVSKTVSNWMEYYGSSNALLADLEILGADNFRRDILRLCKSKSEMSYFEIKEQIDREVLFYPEKYYNNFVGCRIHGNHLKYLQK